MKCVFMAGGKGTRIASVSSEIPKPMIPIDGKPVLEHEIECLREQGFLDFIVTVGHLGNVIMDYFGDGSKLGVRIKYYIEKEPLGNAGALFKLKEELTEDFLLLNADVLFNVVFERFVECHKKSGALVTLFTHPNDHPYDSGLIVTNEMGEVINWLANEDKRDKFYKNRVNAGLHIISPEILSMPMMDSKVDLDRHILKPLAGTGKMYVYDSSEYVKDMGTPERLEEVRADFSRGLVDRKSLRNKQRAVFLDRDGVINKYVGFLREIDSFELLPGVADAVRKLNRAGWLVIVVTNQPVIARGELTHEQLHEIHNKMETLLGEKGAYVDAIYFCPHHPDGGYEGEVTELKISCSCRKPKPGMLIKAAMEHNIDLIKSWMVGDSENDIKAGIAAGCTTALISNENEAFGQDIYKRSLLDTVRVILNYDSVN